MQRDLYLVCYDICGDGSDRRLRRVYKVMRGYGDHLQYSVFRCTLTELQLARMEQDLSDVIDHRKDQVMIVPLGPADNLTSWETYTLGIPMDAPERVVRIV